MLCSLVALGGVTPKFAVVSQQQDTELDPSHPRKMGSKQIAQETFDDAVQENITEFEMDPEEAVREAVQQFESQGIGTGWAFHESEGLKESCRPRWIMSIGKEPL